MPSRRASSSRRERSPSRLGTSPSMYACSASVTSTVLIDSPLGSEYFEHAIDLLLGVVEVRREPHKVAMRPRDDVRGGQVAQQRRGWHVVFAERDDARRFLGSARPRCDDLV